jgi:CubicO group peptidase (beta-lactamase class C family)
MRDDSPSIVSLATVAALLLATVVPAESASRKKTGNAARARLTRTAIGAVNSGKVTGIQILIGRDGEADYHKAFGRRGAKVRAEVDHDTLFCIGSSSKPVAAVTLLRLVDSGRLELDQNIDKWLPAFAHKRLKGGGTIARPPTLAEVLSHRAGIVSQKTGINAATAGLLYRSFDRSLDEVVGEFSKLDYIFEPGTSYAYSGPGYCIAGRIAEVAIGSDFETVLQKELCAPLGMTRTTFFPNKRDANIAVPVRPKQGDVPHLASPHRFTLIGGSLYTSAQDLARFADLIARQGVHDGRRLLSRASWDEMIRPRGAKNYGLGWIVKRDGGEVVELSHNGVLAGYTSIITVHLPSRSYLIILVSMGDQGRTVDVGSAARQYFNDYVVRP